MPGISAVKTVLPLAKKGISWQAYWATQPEVLFFGLYSEITGGHMPNKVAGATDFLTVAGVAGAETYQCPNTAPYIAADTDNVWFRVDTGQRTVTTFELVGYDLQRTPVKYEDDAPNEIIAIIILSADVTGTKRDRLFTDMWLPLLWDNNLNANGHIKSNRVTQNLFVDVENLIESDTVTWLDSSNLSTLTKDTGATEKVSLWEDVLGSGNDLAQANPDWQPVWSTDGVLTNASTTFLKSAAIAALDQPTHIYLVMRQKTWVANAYLMDGNATNQGYLTQRNGSPLMRVYAGGVLDNPGLAVDVLGIVRILFNGASSKIQVNGNAAVTGNAGNIAMGGITFGINGSASSAYGSIQVKEAIFRTVADTAANEKAIYNYLAYKNGLPTI